jgi:chromosome partitioning protein
MIILFGGEKGGTGKTTMAVNMAVLRAMQGRDVLLVNADKQQSAAQWAATRASENHTPHITCVSIYGSTVSDEVRKLAAKFDDVVIDAGGVDSLELRAGMLIADAIVTPAKPSQFDVFTLSKMDKLVGEARAVNVNLQAAILTNIAPTHPNMTDSEEMAEFVEELQNYALLKTIVKDRKAYRLCARDGMAAVEYVRGDEKAAAEMRALAAEVWA